MKALFIGRFQPFHIGHLKVIQDASKEFNFIIIGIGSSQYGNKLDNPFTAEERKKMIELSLKKNGINNFEIALITDIHNPPKWVDHVLSIISDFDVVLTNNSKTKRLFLEKGFTVKETKIYNKNEYSGKIIRNKLIKDKVWQNSVPDEVVLIINQIDGVNRVKNISNK
jgi:nicotinamide-nucleotide adenylyltransferase